MEYFEDLLGLRPPFLSSSSHRHSCSPRKLGHELPGCLGLFPGLGQLVANSPPLPTGTEQCQGCLLLLPSPQCSAAAPGRPTLQGEDGVACIVYLVELRLLEAEEVSPSTLSAWRQQQAALAQPS